jgi:hypothetical protein
LFEINNQLKVAGEPGKKGTEVLRDKKEYREVSIELAKRHWKVLTSPTKTLTKSTTQRLISGLRWKQKLPHRMQRWSRSG